MPTIDMGVFTECHFKTLIHISKPRGTVMLKNKWLWTKAKVTHTFRPWDNGTEKYKLKVAALTGGSSNLVKVRHYLGDNGDRKTTVEIVVD